MAFGVSGALKIKRVVVATGAGAPAAVQVNFGAPVHGILIQNMPVAAEAGIVEGDIRLADTSAGLADGQPYFTIRAGDVFGKDFMAAAPVIFLRAQAAPGGGNTLVAQIAYYEA